MEGERVRGGGRKGNGREEVGRRERSRIGWREGSMTGSETALYCITINVLVAEVHGDESMRMMDET